MPTTDRRRSSRRTSAPSSGAGPSGDAPAMGASGGTNRTNGSNGSATHQNQRQRSGDDPAPIIPILARRVREVEAKSMEGKVGPAKRTKFQVIALLVREERARIKSDTTITAAARTELLKRLDGVATILAKTAAHDTSLLRLLDGNATPGPAAQRMRLEWLIESGAEVTPEMRSASSTPVRTPTVPAELAAKQVLPASVPSGPREPLPRPDLSHLRDEEYRPGCWPGGTSWTRCTAPLSRAPAGCGVDDPPPLPSIDRYSPPGLELMPHQIRMIESVREGTAPSSWPTSPVWARPRSRSSPRPSRTRADARGRPERREDQLGPRSSAGRRTGA